MSQAMSQAMSQFTTLYNSYVFRFDKFSVYTIIHVSDCKQRFKPVSNISGLLRLSAEDIRADNDLSGSSSNRHWHTWILNKVEN